MKRIAELMGCAVLPHLRHLVECVKDGITDEQPKVRTITALALAALAEASFPYGIESFDCVFGTSVVFSEGSSRQITGSRIESSGFHYSSDG